MCEIPHKPFPIERLAITHDVEKLYGNYCRHQSPCFVGSVTVGLQPLNSLPSLGRIIISNLILDNLQNHLSKLRICVSRVHTSKRLTPELRHSHRRLTPKCKRDNQISNAGPTDRRGGCCLQREAV